jgi:NADPH:quinone reductase-like Zn-dependent oxidoreductase
VLEFRDVPIPAPAAGEVIVKTYASSINRGELMGRGSVKAGGGDAAGIVYQLGGGVTDWRIGDKVFGRVSGGWAEYATARADQLMPLGERLSWEQAAAVGVAFLAAYELIYPPYGRLADGETLLVAGASSGVGVAAMQLGKALGATVIGTSGSAAKLEKIKELGLDHGIHTRGPDFAGRVIELTGGTGADLALDLIGGSVFAELMRSLARKGRLGIAGYVDGVMEANLDLALLHANRIEIFGVSNAKMPHEERAAVMRGFVRDVLPLLNSGAVVPVVDRVFSFDQLPEAKSYVESNSQVGKVIIRIGG